MTEIAIERGAQPVEADPAGQGNARPTSPDGRCASGGTAPGGAGRRHGIDPLFQVRTADIEPYTGLRYLSKLFRMIAVVLVLLLIAEVVTGLVQQGTEAISTLLAEVSRLIVLAGLLWGIGDLAILLIDVGHDVRAARILIGRQTAHLAHPPQEAHAVAPVPVSASDETSDVTRAAARAVDVVAGEPSGEPQVAPR